MKLMCVFIYRVWERERERVLSASRKFPEWSRPTAA